jgi:hypothetical protein
VADQRAKIVEARPDWQRPPFEPGNEVAVRHGAYSPRRVDPLARELVDQALADEALAYLRAPRWRAGVWAWARAEARVQLLTEWLADHREGVDELGTVAPVLGALLRWEVRASNARTWLGLDPLSAARLGRDVTATSVDMARLLSGLHAPADLDGEEEVGDGDDAG